MNFCRCGTSIPSSYAFCSEECHDSFYINNGPLCINCNLRHKDNGTAMGMFCGISCQENHYSPALRMKKMPDPEFSSKKQKNM
jgi:hypothetical protein